MFNRIIAKDDPKSAPENSSSYFCTVPSSLLSEPYGLLSGARIKGVITDAKMGKKTYSELAGKEITLILKVGVGFDYLYISKDDWIINFREWGLVLPGYTLALVLTEAFPHKTKRGIGLFTKEDVLWLQ